MVDQKLVTVLAKELTSWYRDAGNFGRPLGRSWPRANRFGM